MTLLIDDEKKQTNDKNVLSCRRFSSELEKLIAHERDSRN